MPCHVPSASLPSSTGTRICGLISDARMCEGAFGPSGSSTCFHSQPSSTTFSSADSRSCATAGSAPSLIVTPAVVCGTYTSAAAAPLAGASASCTSLVMSTSCVPRSVLRRISSKAPVSYERMPAAPPSDREVDAYREQADRFIAELDEEFYLHYAGLKDTFDLTPIYERHANLTEREQVQSIGLSVDGGARVRELWRFACEGYFGDLTRDHAEKLAELESELSVTVDGEQIPYRMVRPALANEPDRDKRRELDARANDVLDEHMNSLHLDAARVVQQGARELGFENYLELYRKALPASALDEHTEHFAHTSRDLSMEEKRLGDNAVTEGWAMLLQHLTDEPAWLTQMLTFQRPHEYAVEGGTGLLYFVRRYAAKILYELEFHSAADVTTMRARYAELLSDALKIDVTPVNYLADIDSGFYVSSYLRSWAFEAQLRSFLKEKFGTKWFASRDAGSLLRELWGEGQKMRAEEMLKEVTGSTLEMEAVAERVREVLT